ncbi:hypothetical protein ASPSYDRAFT_880098 [Aspergillus sydowii CBS 593.65]|uniref:Uncharacterized protein n=1 Tax=Aspergillus sydowii CBS 593.65 TaxID=1036612 RepID=A0A1L9TJF0_9EURO|nr:uncharacterized protein ASPSYDRAFT_880098 [Aspergillus sydowii CBS 593.65]OJJ59546.1 hypothetical protein ASPSYDRAFT_880098 [Aspergillus sydowii CBS 593.65]
MIRSYRPAKGNAEALAHYCIRGPRGVTVRAYGTPTRGFFSGSMFSNSAEFRRTPVTSTFFNFGPSTELACYRMVSMLGTVVEGATDYRNFYLFTRTLQKQPSGTKALSLPEVLRYRDRIKKPFYGVFMNAFFSILQKYLKVVLGFTCVVLGPYKLLLYLRGERSVWI